MAGEGEGGRVLLDSEALAAYARNAVSFRPIAAAVERLDASLHASTITLAEVTDGTGRDVGIRRAIRAVELHEVTAEIGLDAGRRRGTAARGRRKKRDLTVDSVVAASAVAHRATVVLTSDPLDLELLLGDSGIRVERI